MALVTIRTYASSILARNHFEKIKYLSYKTVIGNESHQKNKTKFNVKYLGVGAGAIGFIFFSYYEKTRRQILLASLEDKEIGCFRKDLPNYTLEEVYNHSEIDTSIWVSYKQGVYDITEFVKEHPGGDQILMAAGSSVEPFWLLYGVHKTPKILNMMEGMRIGNLSEEDAKEAIRNMNDPYAGDPRRHRILKPASEKPFNAEPPSSILVDNFYTPSEIFYVRNHLPVPEVDPKTYELELEVDGVAKTKILTLNDIKKLPKYTLTATIMCAGNRRSEMDKIKEVRGLSWGSSAVGNAEWAGARLVDVLKLMGIDENTKGFGHVHFEGLDTDTRNVPYAASIPFSKAVDKNGDVLLAYEMNGQPLLKDHGFPIRAVVPGTVGARNVKWLGKIIVSEQECTSHWQQADYKGCSPSTEAANVNWSKFPAIQELPVISAICKPSHGDCVKVEDGHISVKGYAWSGGGRKIIRVDLTIDGGKTWIYADFDHQDISDSPHHWSWTIWSAKIPAPKGTKSVEIWAKAVDSSYNTQPDSISNIWNFRGVLNNAYHRVKVNLG